MQPLHNDDTLLETPISYFRYKGIKIRFKDIEDAIGAYPHIRGAAVVCSEDKEGNRRLVAYIIPTGAFSQAEVTNFLSGKLKPFMIPAIWVCVKKFPLTAMGTIDKNALHEPEPNEVEHDVFTTPRNRTERIISRIIQEVLKVDNISINDNFLKLGGSSLHALKVIAAIRKELSISVDIKYFFVYPTVADLAAYLNGLSVNANSSYPQPSVKQQFNTASVLRNPSIVPIKAGGKKKPLYIVCGGGGTVFTFEKFAYMLDEDQPVYGFQQPSDENELGRFPETIEDMAAKYVEEMLMLDPDGPYALSGHCIGGAIALEMALRLQSMGKKIHLLAMFDVLLTDEQEDKEKRKNKNFNLSHFIKKAGIFIWQKIEFEIFLLVKHTKDALDYKWENIKVFLNKFHQFWKEDTDFVVFTKFEKMFERAYANYKVKSYSGDMLIFYAKDHYKFVDKDRNIRFKKQKLSEEIKNKWKNYAGNVKIFEVDGEHSSIFEPSYSNNFAGLLQQHLQTG